LVKVLRNVRNRVRGLPPSKRRAREGLPQRKRRWSPGFVEGDAATPNDPFCGRIVNEPRRGVKSVADKDSLPSFGRKLRTLGGVDVDVCGTTKNADVGKVRVATSEGREGDDRRTF
jgi:hypothetical protein